MDITEGNFFLVKNKNAIFFLLLLHLTLIIPPSPNKIKINKK